MLFIGELSALFTAFLWSAGAMVFAAATQRVGSFQVNITRQFFAAIFLFLLILLFQFNTDVSTTQILYLSISGLIGLTLGDTFLFKAFQEIGARLSMLIMSIAPAIAALLAFLFVGESLSMTGVLGIGITVFGIGVVVLERKSTGSGVLSLSPSGLLYGVLGAVGQGAGLVFAKMAFQESDLNGFVAAEIRILASVVVLLPIAFMTRRFRNPVRMFTETREAFWLTVAGSIFGPVLGISFSLIAIKHAEVGIAATIMAIVPVIMLPMVRIIHKERLTWRAVIGALVAVAGVAVLFLR